MLADIEPCSLLQVMILPVSKSCRCAKLLRGETLAGKVLCGAGLQVRAKQYYSDDKERIKNLGILLHGDGSFSGQGVVYETLDMSALPDYTVGGTIHIVVNNQVCGRPPSCLHASPLPARCSL